MSVRLALVATLAACQSQSTLPARCLELPPDKSPTLAKVGGVSVTAAQLEKRLREQGSKATQRYSDPARLRAFLEDQVRLELLVAAALERGLDRDPDVIEAARRVMVRKLLQQDLGAHIFGEVLSEEAVRAYYESHLEDYQQPPRRRLAHIQLAPTVEGRAQAQDLIAKLDPQSPELARTFEKLAVKHSLDAATRGKGGEFNSFVAEADLARDFGTSFAAEAFRLGASEVAMAPVQSTRGWHVVLVLAEREGLARSFEVVKEEIKDRLLQAERSQQFEKYLRDIRQRYPVALYEDELPELVARLRAPSEAP